MPASLTFNDPATKPESIDAPAPSDARTAASVKNPLQLLLDYCQWLDQQLIAGAVAAWTMPLVLAGYKRMTYTGGATDDLPVPLAADGHVDGGVAVLFIPANSCNSDEALHLAPDLELDGDAFVASLDYKIVVERMGGRCWASGRSLPAADAVAPTLLSATVGYADQNALVLAFDEPVFLAGIAGLSLAFSVGTARTITAIEAGNGTASITLTLSGNVGPSDVFTLDVDAETIQDMNGNWLAAASDFACTNNVDEPVFADTWIFLRGDNLGADGSSIATWSDQSGEGNDFTQSTAGERPTVLVDASIGNQKCANFDGTDDSLINVVGINAGGVAVPDVSSFTVLIVWKHDGTTADIPFSFADVSGGEFTWSNFYRESGTLGFYVLDNAAPASVADSSTAWRYAVLIHRGASRDLDINGALAGTNATAKNPAALKIGRLGRGVYNGYGPLDGKIAEIRVIGRELTAQEIADWEAYVGVRYGL